MRKLRITELNRLTTQEFKEANKTNVVAVLDNVRSLHNVGSVFRTADAFCLKGVYLCGITDVPPNNEIHKTALGAEDAVDWKYYKKTEDAVDELRSNGYTIIAIEQVENSTYLTSFSPCHDKRYALIFGNEVKGVQQKVIDKCDHCIEIPQFGTKHSLNISVSAGIVFWEMAKNKIKPA